MPLVALMQQGVHPRTEKERISLLFALIVIVLIASALRNHYKMECANIELAHSISLQLNLTLKRMPKSYKRVGDNLKRGIMPVTLYNNPKIYTIKNPNLCPMFPANITVVGECSISVTNNNQQSQTKKWLIVDEKVMYSEEFILEYYN